MRAKGRKGAGRDFRRFFETGPEGKARQAELLNVCRSAGMRLIGPNCMGIANTNPAVLLDATFAPGNSATGRVGFSSQSGALGLAIMEFANSLGLGISTLFPSVIKPTFPETICCATGNQMTIRT